MDFWTKKRSRQLVALILMTSVLALSGVLVAYADTTDTHPSTSVLVQAPLLDGADIWVGTTPTATITATVPSPTLTPTPIAATNVITNGGFEDGFVEGVGVAVGWGNFASGDVFAGWYDDTWSKVVYEGEHAQLLELRGATQPNRYVGIYQMVSVVPNADYALTLHGLVRSDEGSVEASNYGYRMQYGIDYTGGTNWKTETDKLTLFIRGLKKWADENEGNYDIDGVSLVGPYHPGVQPTTTPMPGMPETGNAFGFLDNSMLVISSAALLVVLVGGAVWGLSRRRA
ncbi:MAG: hypothetical protein P8186_21720 [Anaerolineae bacterium]